jgi:hypothetical protein
LISRRTAGVHSAVIFRIPEGRGMRRAEAISDRRAVEKSDGVAPLAQLVQGALRLGCPAVEHGRSARKYSSPG